MNPVEDNWVLPVQVAFDMGSADQWHQCRRRVGPAQAGVVGGIGGVRHRANEGLALITRCAHQADPHPAGELLDCGDLGLELLNSVGTDTNVGGEMKECLDLSDQLL